MNFVRPININAPSGQPSTPRIVERRVGQEIFVEAHWYDPVTGIFIHKGVVEIKPVEADK